MPKASVNVKRRLLQHDERIKLVSISSGYDLPTMLPDIKHCPRFNPPKLLD